MLACIKLPYFVVSISVAFVIEGIMQAHSQNVIEGISIELKNNIIIASQFYTTSLLPQFPEKTRDCTISQVFYFVFVIAPK